MGINNDADLAPRRWITLGDGQEPTFKGIILPATKWRITREHDFASHSALDVPGGIVETTGRKSYRIDLDLVWSGADWAARLANAVYVHDTDPSPGELIIPDGPVIDAVWVGFPEDRAAKENGTRTTATFVESSDVVSPISQVAKGNPFADVWGYIPDSCAESLLPLVEAYQAACVSGLTDAMARALQALVALDTAAYFAQVALDVADAAQEQDFESLMRVRAGARRAWPDAWVVDLRAVLGCR